jgi:hypothetical protein
MQESLAMREKLATRNPEDARAQDQLGYAFRARAGCGGRRATAPPPAGTT